jgi:FemAB-related protein (PEP-CTERM system-associated)
MSLSHHPGWLNVLEQGLRHETYALEAVMADQTCGLLPLAYVRSLLFGRFLVSLPYLNTAGILAKDESVRRLLIDRAIQLAEELRVRYLELRHEQPVAHPALANQESAKVHMRLALPSFVGQLWQKLPAKVRNQVRKGEKSGLSVAWGGQELLGEFYSVFSHNMRDLGTPVYSRRLFQAIQMQFGDRAEICVVRAESRPVAAALLLHGWGVSEVPSASSLRQFNHTCANMLLYWQLLERAVLRQQDVFDFGRSSPESPTYRFKKQWGAQPEPAIWQYYLRNGDMIDMRPTNPKYRRFIRIWQWLPVSVTRLLGPLIVRGIP